ncbi:hypothetical protein [Clostridium sp. LIBA-8841]|uniref:hypothetical protein n=1 Tax=Clostridium sp. LIBA-8841 TaxID=2987530 RepID=UPI002AC77126|nr:hypothetical protein [Clostridium sp. LIBA-8841]MDZ5252514.1 hypothetical protein [Clostridium sp. LIBA-8841]
MGNFFLESDFRAFDIDKSRNRDKFILEGRRVTADKLRELHNSGLLEFMNSRGLSSHWEKQYITSITWPSKRVNDEYVDRIYLSYGKNRADIRKLIKVLNLFHDIEGNRIEDDMVFNYIPQIQLGISGDSWNTALYLDKYSTIEQRNLVNKIRKNYELKEKFENILMALEDKGYKLYLIKDNDYRGYENESEYVEDIIRYTDNGEKYCLTIRKDYDKKHSSNSRSQIIDFVRGEFDNLMDVYYFVSWDSEENDYLR